MKREQHEPYTPTPEETERAERRSDQGVENGFMSRVESEGAYPETSTPRSYKTRPLGRAAVDGSGRDESIRHANEYAKDHPIDPVEQREINARGRAGVEVALDEAFGKERHIQAIQDDVERFIPLDPDDVAGSIAARERMLNTRLRIFFDRQRK